MATCAACWLSSREAQERLHEDQSLLAEANTALAEAGLKLKGDTPIKQMAEVLIEDVAYEALFLSASFQPLWRVTMAKHPCVVPYRSRAWNVQDPSETPPSVPQVTVLCDTPC